MTETDQEARVFSETVIEQSSVVDEELRLPAEERARLATERENMIAVMRDILESLDLHADHQIVFTMTEENLRQYIPESLLYPVEHLNDKTKHALLRLLAKIIHYLDLPQASDNIDLLTDGAVAQVIQKLERTNAVFLDEASWKQKGRHGIRRALRRDFFAKKIDHFDRLYENKKRINKIQDALSSHRMLVYVLKRFCQQTDFPSSAHPEIEGIIQHIDQLQREDLGELITREYNDIHSQNLDLAEAAQKKDAFIQRVCQIAVQTLRLTSEALQIMVAAQKHPAPLRVE